MARFPLAQTPISSICEVGLLEGRPISTLYTGHRQSTGAARANAPSAAT